MNHEQLAILRAAYNFARHRNTQPSSLTVLSVELEQLRCRAAIERWGFDAGAAVELSMLALKLYGGRGHERATAVGSKTTRELRATNHGKTENVR